MKKFLASILAGVLLTGLLINLPMVNDDTASFARELFFLPVFAFSWSWAGLDCPNADTIADKLSCLGISVAVHVVVYSALFYLLLWLISRVRARRTDKVAAA